MYPCGRCRPAALSRREMLRSVAAGFGALALAVLQHEEQLRAAATNPFAPKPTHLPARARRVIFLYMDGGPSQVDTWDPKPELTKRHGQPFPMKIEPTQFDNIGTTMASPWKFQPHGDSGIPVSELFPHVARHVDRLAVIRSMTSEFSEHTNANYFLHTGSGLQGRPSMGAWLAYGLGTECQDLPAFVVLNGGLIPPGGLDNFNSGFLPAAYQGSIFQPGDVPVANIRPQEKNPRLQQGKLALMQQLDRRFQEQLRGADPVEAAIANYELAFRMQAAVPELVDISQETETTVRRYGLDSAYKPTAIFGRQCLIARRLVERGVRFIELTCPNVGHDRWDQHSRLKKGHEDNARAVDQPIGALLEDLASRGLLDDTLVVWAGEFGRTPFAQGSDGRDHNPFGFSIWMAGGGVKGGTIYGATDEFGYKVIENRVEIHDLHATMLYLLGIDHTRLTFHFGGRDMRLTDVKGHVLHDIIA
ncbi:MAG: sulfatase [Pirellulaceae bacterium]|nr:MAG: sulfatase [Pirellulaceae bacterium]